MKKILNNVFLKNNKMLTTALYHLYVTAIMSISLLATLILNVIVGVIVKLTVDAGGGSTDFITFTFSLILGIVFFSAGYKFAIINGTSRRSYFVASMLALCVTSLVWSIVTVIDVVISERAGNAFTLTTAMYGAMSFGSFLWILSVNTMLMSLGLLMRLIFFRTNKKSKLIIFLGSVVFSLILIVVNILTDGSVGTGLGKFIIAVLGLKNGQNPYIGSLFLIGLFGLFCVFNYLLIRRAQIK